MTNATTTSSGERDAAGRFQSGNRLSVGHGRPRGSRALLSDVFLTDLLEAWQRDGALALARVATEEPGTFLKVCASVLPSKIEHDVSLFADAQSFAEAFELAMTTIGGNPDAALRRLRKSNPRLIEAMPIDD